MYHPQGYILLKQVTHQLVEAEMVKVIDGQLTSPCNAHSLGLGDFVVDAFRISEVTGTKSPRWVENSLGRRLVIDLWFNGRHLIIGANTPVNRVVGARSAGQIN